MATARSKVIDKIKALFARAADAASSEAEVAMALKAARKLMDAHDLDEDDLSFGGEGVTSETRVVTDHDRIRTSLARPVAAFCHCTVYHDTGLFDSLVYVGLASETLFAHWLLDMLADFVTRRLAAHPREIGVRRLTRLERNGFVQGCVERIAERLAELTPRPVAGNGRDLVIARQSLIEAYLAERGIKLKEPFQLHKVDMRSYAIGRAAGDDAEFNRPINEETQIKGLLT